MIEASTAGEIAAPRVRHSWVKLQIHRYVCRACGLCYENRQDRTGGWFKAWFLPDRTTKFAERTPPCEPGPATAGRLRAYEAAIAVATAEREPGEEG